MRHLLILIFLSPFLASAQEEEKEDPYVHNFVKSWAHPFLQHLIAGRTEQAYKENTTAHFRATVPFEKFKASTAAFDLTSAKSFAWSDHDRTLRYGRGAIHGTAVITLTGGTRLEFHAFGIPQEDTEPHTQGDNYLLDGYEFELEIGTVPDRHFAPPREDCLALLRNSLALFVDAQASGDFTAFRAATSTPWQEFQDAEAIKTAFTTPVSRFDYSFLKAEDTTISLFLPEINNADLLHLRYLEATSTRHFRKLEIDARYAWEDNTWKLQAFKISPPVHHNAKPLEKESAPAPDAALALAKDTLADWKTALLEKKFPEFAAAHASPLLIETAGGAEAMAAFYQRYTTPDNAFGLPTLDTDAIKIEDPLVIKNDFLRLNGYAPMGKRFLKFTFDYWKENGTWKLAALLVDHTDEIPDGLPETEKE